MDLEARIGRLERRNRTLTCVALLAAIAAPLGYLVPRMGAADEPKASAVDVAEKLVLRSASGAVAATLVSTPSGSNLTLCDAAGKPRMVFAVGKDGPNLIFLDSNQASANKGVKLALSANAKSGPSVALFGDETTPLASLRTKPGAGAAAPSGLFVAVNEENRSVAFPRATKTEGDESKPAATTSSRN